MLKKLMVSAAVSALMVSGAMAQADPPSGCAEGGSAESRRETGRTPRSSFRRRVPISGCSRSSRAPTCSVPDNAQVGDVNDMLFDKNGKIIGLIVGVGGFLGIGEKSVAIDMGAFQVVPASTGSTDRRRRQAAGGSDDPTNVKLKVSWTKDQLKNAPDFQYYKPPARRGTSRPGGGGAPSRRHGTLASVGSVESVASSGIGQRPASERPGSAAAVGPPVAIWRRQSNSAVAASRGVRPAGNSGRGFAAIARASRA